MKARKKLLSLLLSAAMIVSLLPTAAFAAAEDLPAADYTVSYDSKGDNGGYSIAPAEGAALTYADKVLTITTEATGKTVLLDETVPTGTPTIKIAVGEVRFAKSGQAIKLNASNKEHVYTAQADDSALSMGAPHTVTAGSIKVEPASGTPTSDSWNAAEGATLTLGEVTVVGGEGGATLANSTIPTAGGTIASLTGPVNDGSSFTIGGVPYAVTAGGTTFEDGSLKTGAATVTGPVEDLTVLGGTLTVNGNVTGTLTMGGDAVINVTGDVYKVNAAENSTGTLTIVGNVTSTEGNSIYFGNSDATVKVTGTVAGKIYTGGAGTHTAMLTIGKATFKVHEASAFHASATFDGDTLTIDGGKITAVPGDANIPYDVVMTGGTFDAAGKKIEADVTFASTSTNSTVLSTGYTPGDPFITGKVTWEKDAQGALGTVLNSATKHQISIGANAKAWFMEGVRLDLAELDETNGIGDGATVGVPDFLYQEVIAAMKKGGRIGDGLTFYIKTGTKLGTAEGDGPITTAEGSTLTIKGYASPAADVTKAYAQTITVSKGSTLNLGGTDAGDGANTNRLVLTGALKLDVAENAVLNLTNVDLDGNKEDHITVADGGKVNYINSDGGEGGSDITTGKDDDTDIGEVDAENKLLIAGLSSLAGDTTFGDPVFYNEAGEELTLPEENKALTVPVGAVKVVYPVLFGGAEIGALTSTNGNAVLELKPGYTLVSARLDGATVYGEVVEAPKMHSAKPGATPTPVSEVGETFTFLAAGGKALAISVGQYAEGETRTEAVVTYNDTADTVHNDKFIVTANSKMTVNLSAKTTIGPDAAFELSAGSTIEFVGTGENAILAPITIASDGVTVVVSGIAWSDGATTASKDRAVVTVAPGVKDAKLTVKGDSSVTGTNGAAEAINTTNPVYTQSVAIMNSGALTIEAEKDATLSVTGGTAAMGLVHANTPDAASNTYFGGAGVHNTATGTLTFSGEGVIAITGGTGSLGANGTGQHTNGGAYPARGGNGGFGLYNLGGVTVTMTSAQWAQGQLAITGGNGGNGGVGQPAVQGTHVYHSSVGLVGEYCSQTVSTSGGKGGIGGDSASAVSAGSNFRVDSGVFLTYSGTNGVGGSGGPANPASSVAYCDLTHSGRGPDGVDGVDAVPAIVGTNMTVNGGTIYAQSGGDRTDGYGIFLSGTATISGGSIWAGTKAGTGFDDAKANALSTDVAGDFAAADGFRAAKISGTKFNTNPTAYARVKFAGLEGGVYRVVGDIELSVNGTPYTYGGDSLYVNPQGFAYLYLPENSDAADDILTTYTTTIVRVVVEDAAGVRYLLHSEKPVTLSSGTRTKANNYIELTGTWCEEFTVDGKTYATGVNTAKTVDEKGTYLIKTPSDLATLAYRVNQGLDTAGKYYTVYKDVTEVDMSAFPWNLPIGTEQHPFRGIFGGSDNELKTIKGLRMPADFTGEAYGLFGYLDGADIYSIKVSNAAIAGTPYVKTLAGSYDEADSASGMKTKAGVSGGEYDYAAADLKWASATAAYMGGIAGSAVNGTKVRACTVESMDMISTSTADNVYIGGIAGYTKDSSIAACTVGSTTAADLGVKLATNGPKTAAYAGGLAGYAEGCAIGGDKVGCTTVTADLDNSVGAKAYAGGVAGYAKNTTISDVDQDRPTVAGTNKITAYPGTAKTADIENQVMYAGGVAGYAEGATIQNFGERKLDKLDITANTNHASHKAYAGGVTGASEHTTYDNILFATNGDPSTVTAQLYGEIGETVTGHYAGGLTASSTNDTVRNVAIIGVDNDDTDVTVTAADGKSGGFAAIADGSHFYRSFVRGVKMDATGSYVSMIQNAKDVEMVGCYAQGVTAPTHAFSDIAGGKYVGCYSTNGAWSVTNTGTSYNCYYVAGDKTATDTPDTLVAVTADTLKNAAMAAMTAELMKTEGAEHTNDSGFDWKADFDGDAAFGTPIGYAADATSPVNGGYPVHGAPHLVEVLVTEGAEYGTAAIAAGDGIYPVASEEGYASYYVMGGSVEPVVTVTPATNVTLTKYSHDSTEVSGTFTEPQTFTASAISGDTRIEIKLTPNMYQQFGVVLKDDQSTPADSGSASNSSGAGSVTLSGSEVHYYETADKTKLGTADAQTDTAPVIHTLILTASGGASITMPAMTGWTKVETGSASYLHYTYNDAGNGNAGKTAAEVQALLRQVKVTFSNSARGAANAKDFEVNASVSDRVLTKRDTFNSETGHFYAAGAGSRTWANAEAAAKLGSNAGFQGYLAIVDDAAENSFLTALPDKLGLPKTTGWINANDHGAEGKWLYTGPNGVPGEQEYSNWQKGEPNNAGTDEDYAAMYASGFWNDYPAATTLTMTFVEYGGYATTMRQAGSNLYQYTVTNTSTGGGGSGTTTKPTKPEDNGVSKLLNSTDHMAYLQGYNTGDFGPADEMTRAEVVMMFYRLLRNQNVKITVTFEDVPEGVWYAKAANTLATLGIVKGVGGDRFAPERAISRAEFVAIALRFADELTPGTKTFTDVTESHWAYDYIMAATGYGWIGGYSDSTFKPQSAITRAEAATIVNRMLSRSADKAFVKANAEELISFPDVAADYWAYGDIVEATNAHDYDRDKSGTESWKK